MRLICSQTLPRSSPLCITCMRRWSSSLIIRLNFSRLSMATARRALAFGVLAADQMPLDQELAVDFLQLAPGRRTAVRLGGDAENPLVQDLLDPRAVLGRGPADEREIGQIPGQPDAAADDDVGLGPAPRSHSPLLLRQIVQLHGVSSPSLSIRWISSRSCEARS